MGLEYDLKLLLTSITDAEINKNELFFGNLANSIKLFETLYELIKERKISCIDDKLVEELLSVNDESYRKMLQ